MNRMQTDLSYRKTAIEGASAIGLVIALYDTLAGNMRRAASALRNNNIEERCRELNHAALVLGQLEDWIDHEKGGDLAKNLSDFYASLRAMMMQASASKSPQLLEAQMNLVLQVRSTWQQRDAAMPPAEGSLTNTVAELSIMTPTVTNERVVFTRSA